jgi:hypothetical protein
VTALDAATVAAMEPAVSLSPAEVFDVESREWLRCLRAAGVERDEAVARLHELLLHDGGRRYRTCAAVTSTTLPTRPRTTH